MEMIKQEYLIDDKELLIKTKSPEIKEEKYDTFKEVKLKYKLNISLQPEDHNNLKVRYLSLDECLDRVGGFGKLLLFSLDYNKSL